MRYFVVLALLVSTARADAPSGYQCAPGSIDKGVGCRCPAGYASKRADENIAICAAVPKVDEVAQLKQECSKLDAPVVLAFSAGAARDAVRRQLGPLVIKRCEAEPWARESRTCFARARTEEAAFQCIEKLPPGQRASLEGDAASVEPPAVELTKTQLKLTGRIVFAPNGLVSDASSPLITEIVRVLAAQPTLRIEIQVDTDDREGNGDQLTQTRADGLRTRLISAGIASSRLVAKGYGAKRPIAVRTTAQGRATNRRVELQLLAPAVVAAKPAASPDDRDGDGIVDRADRCPEEAETYNGTDDGDGCPDRGRLVVTDTTIETLDKVYFEFNKPVIKAESNAILDQLAAVLTALPGIELLEIQGHSDERGDDTSNLRMTGERAEAVLRYLVAKGIDAKRLVAKGYGETQPLDPAHNEAAWAKNRRIAFVVLTRR